MAQPSRRISVRAIRGDLPVPLLWNSFNARNNLELSIKPTVMGLKES